MSEIRRFLRIAHRGASGYCPENTRSAFLRAIELGADMIELDVQLAADGAVIVCHDERLERTTDGRGTIEEKTLRELKELDAGSWFDARFAGEELLTLEEALDTIGERTSVNVEIKPSRDDSRIELVCLGIVSDQGALERTVFSSFSRRSMLRLREISDEARMGLLTERRDDWGHAIAFAKRLGAEAMHPDWLGLTAEQVAQAHENGLRVRTWPLNDPIDIRSSLRMGVDGIFSDFPDRLLRVAI